MRRSPRRVRMDFVAPVHRARVAGLAICLAGLAAAASVGLAFRRTIAERDRLEAAIQATSRPRQSAPSPQARKRAAEMAAVGQEIAVPWTRLLDELEGAARDTKGRVSLLGVEPDPGKRLVRITAETRSLDDALDYLERLQRSAVLRYPMLESHEIRKDDADHVLRIKLTAEWRT